MITTHIKNLTQIKTFEKHIVLSEEELLNKIINQYLNDEISILDACQQTNHSLSKFSKQVKTKS